MAGQWNPESVVMILMRRDGMTRNEAQDVLDDLKSRAMDGEDPEELLHEIGLEPDYIWDLIG